VERIAWTVRHVAQRTLFDTWAILQFRGIAHTNYLMQRSNERAAHVDFEPVGGVASTSARKLGEVTIGLPPAK
jgi:hypothetical protein